LILKSEDEDDDEHEYDIEGVSFSGLNCRSGALTWPDATKLERRRFVFRLCVS
jgi:hypothetical protein